MFNLRMPVERQTSRRFCQLDAGEHLYHSPSAISQTTERRVSFNNLPCALIIKFRELFLLAKIAEIDYEMFAWVLERIAAFSSDLLGNNLEVIKDSTIKWPAYKIRLLNVFPTLNSKTISIYVGERKKQRTNNDINKAWFPIIYSLGGIFIE